MGAKRAAGSGVGSSVNLFARDDSMRQKGHRMKSLVLVLLLASLPLSLAFVSALPAAAGSDETCLVRDCSAG